MEDQLTISTQNGRTAKFTGIAVIIQFITSLVVGGMLFQSIRDTAMNHERRLTSVEALVSDMEQNGHPDHERRIARLEGMKADATAAAVQVQSNQIDKIVTIVQTDHDSIVALKTLFESQSNK